MISLPIWYLRSGEHKYEARLQANLAMEREPNVSIGGSEGRVYQQKRRKGTFGRVMAF